MQYIDLPAQTSLTNCFRFANVMINTTITNIFNSDNKNIAYIKTKHHLIMTASAYRTSKVETMFKKPIVTSHAFVTAISLSRIRYRLYQLYCNTLFIKCIYQKLILINFKRAFIKIIYHSLIYSFISNIV